jgi:hypothetical protein
MAKSNDIVNAATHMEDEKNESENVHRKLPEERLRWFFPEANIR